MINNKMIDALAYADDEFISESMPLEGADAFKAPRRRRRIRTSLIAVCLVLVLSAAVYAAGVLTGNISIFKTKDATTKTRTATIDGVEVDVIDIDVQIPLVSEKDITGPVRIDAETLLREKEKNNEREWSWVRDNDSEPWRKEYDDYYQVVSFKSFNDQKEALDYIGCRFYEEQYFPYENYRVDVSYQAELTAEGNGASNGSTDVHFSGCNFNIRSIDEKIDVETWTMVALSSATVIKKNMVCNTGIDSILDDGSSTVETFTNSHGYNGAKAFANDISATRYMEVKGYYILGCIVKNNCFYEINIHCDWADKAEADRIFDTWAEHF